MALPTTGLTFHADASVDTDLWQSNIAGVMTDHPVDGESANYWDDAEHGADVLGAAANVPVWRSVTPLMLLPCLDFNGSSHSLMMRDNSNTGGRTLSNNITNSAFTVMVSVYVQGITTNVAGAYDNDGLLTDSAGYFGIHFKNNADPHVLFYNYDGTEDVISLAISLNTSYVLMYRHEGGSIYASLNGGSETSTASGNTQVMTGIMNMGAATVNADAFANVRVGEIAIYNAALTGSNLTDAMSYFTAKWLASSGPVIPVFMNQYRQRR